MADETGDKEPAPGPGGAAPAKATAATRAAEIAAATAAGAGAATLAARTAKATSARKATKASKATTVKKASKVAAPAKDAVGPAQATKKATKAAKATKKSVKAAKAVTATPTGKATTAAAVTPASDVETDPAPEEAAGAPGGRPPTLVTGVATEARPAGTDAPPPPPPPPPPPAPGGAKERGPRAGRPALWIGLMAAVIAVIAVFLLIVRIADDEPEGVVYTDLKVGECFARPPEVFERATLVDCAKPHDLEVFAISDDPSARGAPYPGQEILQREAAVTCLPQFEAYVGKPFDQSDLVFVSYVPTERTWDDHDRRLLCTVSAPEGQQLQGPAKGSRL